MKKRYHLCSILLFLTFSVYAQQNELAQANTQFKSYYFKEAIPLYEKALSTDPFMGDAMVNLAFCYYYTNDTKKAELWFAKIVRYDGYKQYAFEYAQVLKMNQKYDEAKKWFLQYAKIDYSKGVHFANSCDFANKTASLLSNTYTVNNMEALNSKSADFAPTFYYNDLIFASAKSVAIQKQSEIAWTNDAFNQHYIAQKDNYNKIVGHRTLRNFIGNDINDAPMSYVPGQEVVAITSNNFMDGIRHIAGTGLMMDIYTYTIKSKNEWQAESESFFSFNASKDTKAPFSTGQPCLTNNGTTLYFSSNRPGGAGGYDIYVSYRTANGWTMPKNVGAPINTPGNEMSPYVDGNGRIYFSSDWHFGYGGLDVFTAESFSFGWGNVENMGNRINSPADDSYFIFNSQQQVGYFSSNRKTGMGNEDIYKAVQKQAIPSRKSMPLTIGEKFVLDDRYFRPGDGSIQNTNSRQLFDILRRLIDNEDVVIRINGYTDAVGTASNNLILSQNRSASLANYFVSKGINRNRIIHAGYGENFLVNKCKDNVPCSSKEYAQNRRIEIFTVGTMAQDGHINISYNAIPAPNADQIVAQSIVSSKQEAPSATVNRKPKRKSHYAIGDVIDVASIYYEHGKSRIDERKSPGLKQLIEILKDHSHVVIEIGAHTDATGPSKYNKELSEQRALSVKRYLEKNGVTATRLVSKGYGEDKILNRCKEGVRCSSSEHAQNRRTEFKVVAQKGFKVGDVIKVDNINYELNKSKLDMKNSRGLKEVIQLLKDNKISVEIRSHTDSKGSSKYNAELSQQRAQSIYDYLVANGVNKYRLKYKGYGETMLSNKCKDGVSCSDSQHGENRRTDFKVIGLR